MVGNISVISDSKSSRCTPVSNPKPLPTPVFVLQLLCKLFHCCVKHEGVAYFARELTCAVCGKEAIKMAEFHSSEIY